MADSFVFYRSFYEAASCLPDAERLQLFDALCSYALDGEEHAPQGGIVSAVLSVAKPVIDANRQRRESGKGGGRPSKKPTVSENAETEKPSVSEKAETEKPSVSEKQKIQKPNENENVNENVNVNGNINTNDQPRAPGRVRLAAEFEELWKLYPRKEGKKASFAAYVKARTRKDKPVQKVDVYMGIVNYNAMIKAAGTPAQYIMQGATFFRGERWTDDFSHRPRADDRRQDVDRNKFNQGMESHDYDWDELEKELLGYDPNTGQ